MYSPDNVGHFGLAYEHYTHFTSPIRRYPDLWCIVPSRPCCRREIRAGAPRDDIGLQCSATERRADEATRDVENWLKTFFMKERIGEEFDGTISAVTAFGIFVALDRSISRVWSMSPNWGLITSSSTTSSTRCWANGLVSVSAWVTGSASNWWADLESNRIDFVMAQAAAAPQQEHGRSDSAGKTVSRQATRPAKASVKAGQTCGGESRQQGGTQKAASKPAAAPAKAKSASHARPQRNDASAQ
jgi:ribonuclease R